MAQRYTGTMVRSRLRIHLTCLMAVALALLASEMSIDSSQGSPLPPSIAARRLSLDNGAAISIRAEAPDEW